MTPVWRNELGGLTFQIGDGAEREFVKWCPPHPEFDLEREATKLRWAARFITVPPVLGVGPTVTGSWLHTRGIAGDTAISPRWVAEPRTAVRAIALGLRALHDRLPVADCPFSWSLPDRFARIIRPEDRSLVAEAPEVDRLVVCHGDACAPNTLVTTDGGWSGHVDLGSLGVADRWADLAVATYSLGWNFPGRWEEEFLAAYGVEPDWARIDFYRRLWDAT
nr:aminoglycoside 3'-phosphotransferase [Microlunatus panaciterrae]